MHFLMTAKLVNFETIEHLYFEGLDFWTKLCHSSEQGITNLPFNLVPDSNLASNPLLLDGSSSPNI
jgi:hypothetical protein